MPVTYVREELKQVKKRYDVIRDCLGGEITIKAMGVKYLPIPDAAEAQPDGKRYAAYKLRATFYGVTKRTLEGLCGQIFTRDPVIELPDELKFMENDADGSGVSLTQEAKEAVHLVLGYGRGGLFVDYPEILGTATKADIDSGEIKPIIKLYEPWRIINWRTITRGARTLLSLVVLEEEYIEEDDGFEAKKKTQWRVLRLENNIYTVSIWKQGTENGRVKPVAIIPKGADGKPLNEIPFSFIGSKNNDYKVDEPPMYDIAALNVAHYRNSADYEENSFMVGQATPVFAGLTEDWVKNVLKGKVMLGSRGSVSLPSGGSATLLQAQANSVPFEAMQHKEKQMVALGARLAEQRAVVRTATESNIDDSTASSVLASSAQNVAAGFKWALTFCAKFVTTDVSKIKFTLNTDFDISRMSPEDRRQLIQEWQAGAISWEEVRTNLRKSGIATEKDDKARQVIDEELAAIPMNTPVGTNVAPAKPAAKKKVAPNGN